MKNLFIKKLLFLLFITLQTIAQGASFSFSFTLPESKSANIVLLKQISINEITLVNSKSCKPSNCRNILNRPFKIITTIAATTLENMANVLTINGKQQWREVDCISTTDLKRQATNNRYAQNSKGYLIIFNNHDSKVFYFENLYVLDKSKPISNSKAIIFAT